MRYLLAFFLYAGAFVFIYTATVIDPNLYFPASEWTPMQWIAALMMTEGCLLKLAGHALILRIV
jgi:hypothetical protein